MVTLRSFTGFIGVFAMTATAWGESTPPRPNVQHTPISSAPLGDDLTIGASFEHAEQVVRAFVVYRTPRGLAEQPFQRTDNNQAGTFAAVIPKERLSGNQTAYTIEVESTTSGRIALFASREHMQEVTLYPSHDDLAEDSFTREIEGRRNVVNAEGEYVRFGTTDATIGGTPALGPKRTESVADEYYRFEGSYTYRLGKRVTEFGIRFGALRGRSVVPGELDPSRFEVGLNYGAPRVQLRAVDWLHLDVEFLTSVTEVGYAVGGGGAVVIGAPYAMHLAVGVEGVQTFGVRGYTRLQVPAGTRVTLAPSIEITTMPHADRAGVRLLGDASVHIAGGFSLRARAGYQARSFDSGGATLGLGAAFAF
jgi:hypothetical protein